MLLKLIEKPRLIWGIGLLILTLRFLDLGYAPFIGDEPHFQSLIDEHITHGTFPKVALIGSRGIHYGPTALWFYLPIRLFTDRIEFIVFYHALFFTLGWVLFFAIFYRQVDRLGAAYGFLLASSSPYLFFYSRLAWDNTLIVPLASLVLLFTVRIFREKPNNRDWLFLGVTAGLCFSLHLMALPITLLAFFAVLLFVKDRGFNLKSILFFGVGFLSVTISYLVHILPEFLNGQGGATSSQTPLYAGIRTLVGLTDFFSTSGFGYFMDGTLRPIKPLMGFIPGLFLEFDYAVPLKIAAIVYLVNVFSNWKSEKQVVLKFSGALVLIYMLYYFALKPDLKHPHYMTALSWVGIFFAGLSIAHLKKPWRLPMQLVLFITVAINVWFNVSFLRYIHQNSGTQGFHFATALEPARNAFSNACRGLKEIHKDENICVLYGDKSKAPAIQRDLLRFWFNHLKECQSFKPRFLENEMECLSSEAMVQFYYSGQSAELASRLIPAKQDAPR
jgi:hypothetical protein